MLTRRRETKNQTRKNETGITENHTLTLIGTNGSQTPIGEKGAPTFHSFTDWSVACDAIAAAVGSMDRIASIEMVDVRTVQTIPDEFGGARKVIVTHTKYDRDAVAEIYEGSTDTPPGNYVIRDDGRVVRVTVRE